MKELWTDPPFQSISYSTTDYLQQVQLRRARKEGKSSMPRYALDENNRIIDARDADLFRRYRCLECQNPLQKRSGPHRQAHFYHLQTVRQCRLHSQSADHLILQTEIQQIIPSIDIERPFKKILRIADLCWEEKKIVFEICT